MAVFNTLSKRSSMTGYRSGFVAGDPELIAALKQFRPNVGTAPQEFVQRASVVAWGDEEHVERARASYAAQARAVPRPLRAARAAQRRRPGDDVPLGRDAGRRDVGRLRDAPARARRDRRAGIVPRASGEGYVRFALVPTEDECGRAVEILEQAF